MDVLFSTAEDMAAWADWETDCQQSNSLKCLPIVQLSLTSHTVDKPLLRAAMKVVNV